MGKLIKAVLNNDLKKVKTLLSNKKVDINEQDKNGFTALMLSISSSTREAIFTELLKAGPNLDIQDMNGHTALRWAIFWRRSCMLVLLLQHGANPNILSNTGTTDLQSTLHFGYPEMSTMLRLHGATVTPNHYEYNYAVSQVIAA